MIPRRCRSRRSTLLMASTTCWTLLRPPQSGGRMTRSLTSTKVKLGLIGWHFIWNKTVQDNFTEWPWSTRQTRSSLSSPTQSSLSSCWSSGKHGLNFLSLIRERVNVMKDDLWKASGCLSIVRVRKELGVTWVLEWVLLSAHQKNIC